MSEAATRERIRDTGEGEMQMEELLILSNSEQIILDIILIRFSYSDYLSHVFTQNSMFHFNFPRWQSMSIETKKGSRFAHHKTNFKEIESLLLFFGKLH